MQRQLYNVWVKTSELRTSVAMQRIKLQQARQAHKLRSILSTHVSFWCTLSDVQLCSQDEHGMYFMGSLLNVKVTQVEIQVVLTKVAYI